MQQSAFPHGSANGSVSLRAEIEGQKGSAQFRYAREGFRRNLIIAVALTALVCGVTWLLLGIYGSANMNLYTVIMGLLFFAFISARMLAQYLRNEVVLAVQPTGLFDARISSDTISWDQIKELTLLRREQEYSLSMALWPGKVSNIQDKGAGRTYNIDLSSLEGGSEKILSAIQQYMPIKLDR